MEKIVDVLKALSDETRLRIINLLYEQELCVCDIIETLQITQTKASRHLSYLKNAGLVVDRKYAQWVYYSFSKEQNLNFLDIVINNNIREEEIFQNDLKKLKEWFKRKNISCN